MKKLTYFLLTLGLLSGSACKKDAKVPTKAFENISYADIQTSVTQLKSDVITVSDASHPEILKAGSIIFYKTNAGVLGKFKIVSISPQNQLTISLINYNNQGGVLLNKSNIVISATFYADLDLGVQAVSQSTFDFWWVISGPNNEIRNITPINTALFYVYSK